jgi:hypothetical protein
MAYTVYYGFTQPFRVSAREAFAWCTNYDPNDHELEGIEGKRKIVRISDNAVMLEDTFPSEGKSITKKKIVNIYPEKLFWSSVHISGPSKYSQFLYQIVEEGEHSSKIEFTGFQVVYEEKTPSRSEITKIAKRLQKEDSVAWKHLAKAMEKELL